MYTKTVSYSHAIPPYSSLLDSKNITNLPNKNVIKNSIIEIADA